MKLEKQAFDILVIGGGASGLTAASQAAERGATVMCVDNGGMLGGVITNIGKLDSYPTPVATAGATLVDSLVESCKTLDVAFSDVPVISLELSDGTLIATTVRGTISAGAVIIASGARLRQLGVPGEAELSGRGVSQCNWCDGGFFKNEPVIVVGGGDAAFQAAIHLAGFCSSVTVVMRSSTIRARRAYVLQAGDNETISFIWDTVVEGIVGSNKVEKVLLRNTTDNSTTEMATSGIFIFAGTEPNTAYLPEEIRLDASGAVITNESLLTSLPGVYAVGAVRSGYMGQLVSACGEAATAAASAIQNLKNRERL